MEKNIVKRGENIVSVIKTLSFPSLCSIVYFLDKETRGGVAEFMKLPSDAGYHEIAKAIFEYNEMLRMEKATAA